MQQVQAEERGSGAVLIQRQGWSDQYSCPIEPIWRTMPPMQLQMILLSDISSLLPLLITKIVYPDIQLRSLESSKQENIIESLFSGMVWADRFIMK